MGGEHSIQYTGYTECVIELCTSKLINHCNPDKFNKMDKTVKLQPLSIFELSLVTKFN